MTEKYLQIHTSSLMKQKESLQDDLFPNKFDKNSIINLINDPPYDNINNANKKKNIIMSEPKDKNDNDINNEVKDNNINNESINNNSENCQTQNQTQSQTSNALKNQNANYQNVSNENQTSFSMINKEKEKDKENIIEMIYIIDKDKNFEETNILNTFDIKLNVHIDHTQKDKIFFFDYDIHEEGSFNEKKNNIYKFKCSDSKCNAIYHLNMNDLTGKENTNNSSEEDNTLFSKVKDHSLTYEQHDFNIKPTKGQNKYQEILFKYPNIKHVQVISVPDNFDYSTIPTQTLNISDPDQNDDEYINVEENEDEKYSLESEIYDKNNKIDKDEDDDYYSNTSSYKARSRNKDNKKKINKKNKLGNKDKDNSNTSANNSTNNSGKNAPKAKKYENKILEDYEKYMQSGVKQVKKKRQQLYYKPQEYTKWVLSMKNSKYVYAYLPYYKKGREALGKSKAREKWMRYMAFKYGEETTLGPIYYKDKNDGGRIYKFAVNNLSSDADNRKVTYSCHRESCQGRGILNVEEDIFIITEPHSLRKSLCTDIKRHQAIVDYYNAHPDIVIIQTLRQFQEKK